MNRKPLKGRPPCTLDELLNCEAQVIRSGRVAVFCDDGSRLILGLPTAAQLLARIADYLPLTMKDRRAILESGLPFEAFLQRLATWTKIHCLLDEQWKYNGRIPNSELARNGLYGGFP